jgi:hypothetical protein
MRRYEQKSSLNNLKVNFMIHWDAKPDNVQTLSDMSKTPRFPTPNRRQGSCFSKKRRGTRHTALPGMVRPGRLWKDNQGVGRTTID